MKTTNRDVFHSVIFLIFLLLSLVLICNIFPSTLFPSTISIYSFLKVTDTKFPHVYKTICKILILY